jgi:hypothetical protein
LKYHSDDEQIITLLNSLSSEGREKALEFVSLLRHIQTDVGADDELAHKD